MTAWLTTEQGRDPVRTPHRARIAAAGRRLPDTRLTTEALMASTRHRTGVDLERLTGIHERRVAAPDESSDSLATAAARDCLARAGRRGEELDVVLFCGITKFRPGLVQQLEPTASLVVARALGATDATTFDLSNACAGMLTGVFVLNNWIRRGVVRRGLVVSGEHITSLSHNAARHVRTILSRELASLTLGDAGAALLLERAPDDSDLDVDGGTDGGIDFTGFTTVATHSRLCLAYPARHEPGARMFTRSQAIHRAAIADLPALLGEALDASDLTLADVDHMIPHQTSVRAIRKGMAHVEPLLGEPRHPAVVTVDRYGNTASTTHTVALVEEIQAGRIRAGDRVALVALASGLVVGVVLFTVDERLVQSHGHDD